jgi:divalent metal cation (Fe/Co/Zn/Cd) transporter
MSEHKMKSIWFFVGLILLVMGGLIMLNGIYLFFNPSQRVTVLSETHPDIWWGAIMAAFGSIMYFKARTKTV